MIARLPGVTAVQDTGTVPGVSAYAVPLIPPINTNALSVDAATLGLPGVLDTSLARAAISAPPPPASRPRCWGPQPPNG